MSPVWIMKEGLTGIPFTLAIASFSVPSALGLAGLSKPIWLSLICRKVNPFGSAASASPTRPSEVGTPPATVHNTPVPAQIMHSRAPRRSILGPPSSVRSSAISISSLRKIGKTRGSLMETGCRRALFPHSGGKAAGRGKKTGPAGDLKFSVRKLVFVHQSNSRIQEGCSNGGRSRRIPARTRGTGAGMDGGAPSGRPFVARNRAARADRRHERGRAALAQTRSLRRAHPLSAFRLGRGLAASCRRGGRGVGAPHYRIRCQGRAAFSPAVRRIRARPFRGRALSRRQAREL